MLRLLKINLLTVVLTFALAAPALAERGGPLNIATADGRLADGDSGAPAVSGDNRNMRLVAFHSLATNLVAGDTNAKQDVFVWTRPSGRSGETLSAPGIGSLALASRSSSGQLGNGDSRNPSLDGSMKKAPRCVAFESDSTNLVGSDALPDSDIYVRNLASNRTYLASSGIKSPAANPSISGDCKTVVFEAGGSVYQSKATGGKPKKLARGRTPDISMDGTAITWVSGSTVKYRRGKLNKSLGRGSDPQASDGGKVGGWAVAFNSGAGVRLKTISKKGRVGNKKTAAGGTLGGISAYAADRGIITFFTGNQVRFINLNTGNYDTLATANGPIESAHSSARANLIAFAAQGGNDFVDARIPTGQPRPTGIYVIWVSEDGCGTGCR